MVSIFASDRDKKAASVPEKKAERKRRIMRMMMFVSIVGLLCIYMVHGRGGFFNYAQNNLDKYIYIWLSFIMFNVLRSTYVDKSHQLLDIGGCCVER